MRPPSWMDQGKYCLLYKECGWFKVEQFIKEGSCHLRLKCTGTWHSCPMRKRK